VSRARRPVHLNPPTQCTDDRNLAAWQRLWDHQDPPFDLVGWVLGLAGLGRGDARGVLDAGCGNGRSAASGDDCQVEPGRQSKRAEPLGAEMVHPLEIRQQARPDAMPGTAMAVIVPWRPAGRARTLPTCAVGQREGTTESELAGPGRGLVEQCAGGWIIQI
jgi:hypothetical protein